MINNGKYFSQTQIYVILFLFLLISGAGAAVSAYLLDELQTTRATCLSTANFWEEPRPVSNETFYRFPRGAFA